MRALSREFGETITLAMVGGCASVAAAARISSSDSPTRCAALMNATRRSSLRA